MATDGAVADSLRLRRLLRTLSLESWTVIRAVAAYLTRERLDPRTQRYKGVVTIRAQLALLLRSERAGDLWRDRLCGQPGPPQAAHHRLSLDVCHPGEPGWALAARVWCLRKTQLAPTHGTLTAALVSTHGLEMQERPSLTCCQLILHVTDRGRRPPGRRVPAARRHAARQCVGWSHCGKPHGRPQWALIKVECCIPAPGTFSCM